MAKTFRQKIEHNLKELNRQILSIEELLENLRIEQSIEQRKIDILDAAGIVDVAKDGLLQEFTNPEYSYIAIAKDGVAQITMKINGKTYRTETENFYDIAGYAQAYYETVKDTRGD